MYAGSGGGTPVISASAYGLISRIFSDYTNKVGTVYASVGGMRGAIHEDITDVFKYANADGHTNARSRINRLKFYPTHVFGTSRYEPDLNDCKRLMELFIAKNIRFVFLNGGNDTMQKALMLKKYVKEMGYEMYVIGIPKTIDNDLLITHRSPGYMSFAKQVALDTMSLSADLESFAISNHSWRNGPVKEGAVAQVFVTMGRDQAWGAAASVIGQREEADGPHVIITKEGGFSEDAFLNRAQRAWDKHGRLLVVSSEGAHSCIDYLANQVDVSVPTHGLVFKLHEDPAKNTSVTDSRLALYLKLLLENKLKISSEVYTNLKCREEGPGYINRSDLEILSAVDFRDAILVGERAADLAFGQTSPINGVMVTLTHTIGETGFTPLEKVADLTARSKQMTKSIRVLDTAEASILEEDGMMINRNLFMGYVNGFVDLNGPNRSQILREEGFSLPLPRIHWLLEDRILPPYQK